MDQFMQLLTSTINLIFTIVFILTIIATMVLDSPASYEVLSIVQAIAVLFIFGRLVTQERP